MNEFLADQIIEQFLLGELTASEAWKNTEEIRETISHEKYDEIVTLIVENLVETEVIEEDEVNDDLELTNIFEDADVPLADSGWDEIPYEWEDWGSDDEPFNPSGE